jgi:hypothetical protein
MRLYTNPSFVYYFSLPLFFLDASPSFFMFVLLCFFLNKNDDMKKGAEKQETRELILDQ